MLPFRRGTGRLTPGRARTRTIGGTTVPVDVREGPRGRSGHAPGAVHPPLTRLPAAPGPPPAAQGRPVVAIRRSGHRPRQAAGLLAPRGAVDITGGTAARAKAAPPAAGHGQDGRIA